MGDECLSAMMSDKWLSGAINIEWVWCVPTDEVACKQVTPRKSYAKHRKIEPARQSKNRNFIRKNEQNETRYENAQFMFLMHLAFP